MIDEPQSGGAQHLHVVGDPGNGDHPAGEVLVLVVVGVVAVRVEPGVHPLTARAHPQAHVVHR